MIDNNEIMIVNEQKIRDKIYVIRGQQVMLDFDLAEIYGYTTSAFNQQVKRNIDRFPSDFCFNLTESESLELSMSQNVISIQTEGVKGGRSKPIKAFTEQGIYMLMTVLKGDLAVTQSKNLIRLFKTMKDYLVENRQLVTTLNDYVALALKVDDNTKDIQDIKNNMVTRGDLCELIKLFDTSLYNGELMVMNGEPFKADMAYQRIYSSAQKSILIVDNYIGMKTLNHLAHTRDNVMITIASDNKAKPPLRKDEYKDFISEYPKHRIKFLTTSNKVHDRYIILDYDSDDLKVFHCGGSSKDAGKKVTTISELRDTSVCDDMIKMLLNNSPLVLK